MQPNRRAMNSLLRRVTSEAAMALLCLALTFIFFHSAVFPRTKTFLYGDNMLQYYPWMHKLADDWRALAPPLWDFSVEAGFPFRGGDVGHEPVSPATGRRKVAESIWRCCVLLDWAGCVPCFRTSQYFRGTYLSSLDSLFF